MTENKMSDRRAADNLIQIFEAKILKGELQDGDPLPPEREIVETYQVSRTVAREAILALSNKGLVEARPRHRPIVRKPSYDVAVQTIGSVAARFMKTPEGVKNLFDLRIMMEASLVRQASAQANKSHLEKLKIALAANQATIDKGPAFYETDVAFHAILYEIPGNDLLPAIHRAYTGWLLDHWREMPRETWRNQTNYDWHRKIFESILMRDPDAAEAALRGHLDFAWAQVSDTFRKAWQEQRN